MRHGAKCFFASNLLAAALMAASVPGETIIVEAAEGGLNNESYSETFGAWQATPESSTAAGLTQGIGSRLLAAEDGAMEGTVVITPPAPQEGPYYVDITWPGNSNVRAVSVKVDAPERSYTTVLDFGPGTVPGSNTGKWVRLTREPLPAAEQATITIGAPVTAVAFDPAVDLQLAISAVRVTTDQTDITSPQVAPVSAATTGEEGDSPFAADMPSEEEESPFTTDPEVPAAPEGEEEADSPFASDMASEEGVMEESPFEAISPEMQEAANDPFAGTAEVEDPFTQPGEEAVADPFSDTSEPDSPFASEMEDESPFASTETDDPFAQSGSTTTPPAETSVPFGETMDTDTPFASSGDTVTVDSQSASSQQDPASSLGFQIPTEPIQEPTATPSLSIPAQPVEETVYVDVEYMDSIGQGVAAAKRSDRPVLVLFSGDRRAADQFERLLTQEEVAAKMDGFELVRLDYLDNRAKAREFAVRTFPYIVVLNKYGYTIGHVLPADDPQIIIDELSPFTQKFYE